jgi:hypothetical protein
MMPSTVLCVASGSGAYPRHDPELKFSPDRPTRLQSERRGDNVCEAGLDSSERMPRGAIGALLLTLPVLGKTVQEARRFSSSVFG